VIVIRQRSDDKDGSTKEGTKKVEEKRVIVINGKAIALPAGAIVIDHQKLREILKSATGHVDVKQIEKQVKQALQELRKIKPDLIRSIPSPLVVGAVDQAELQKQITKALAELKGQQGKLVDLHKQLGKRVIVDLKNQLGAHTWMIGSRGVRLGVNADRPNGALADQLDLPKGHGLVIEQVIPGTPAAKAGLRAHDILLELNGKAIASNHASLARALDSVKSGTAFDVVILRKGRKHTVRGLTLAEQKKPETLLQPGTGGFRLQGPRGVGQGIAVGVAGQGRNTVLTTVVRRGDHFTTRHQEGSLVITLTGTISDGRAKVSEVYVQDGGKEKTYRDADRVPERYRDKVKNLLEMSEKGQVKVETGKK
jgi:membrane-associated protease RseP (regulator of RpoE activity)